MKIVFYSPYIPKHFGGGEKYLFDTALAYADKHQVFIAVPVDEKNTNLEKIKQDYQDFLGRDISAVHFVYTPLGSSGKKWYKLWWTSKFDVLYCVTDGSAFFSLARRNIMHIQVPLTRKPVIGWEKRKFGCYQIINTNSVFTKNIVERYWDIKVNLVCQPGVDIQQLTTDGQKKEKIILHVGRFFDNLHCKNQAVLVEFFRQLREDESQLLDGWQLVLVGQVESKSYLARVKKLARGLPVRIITNASREQVVDYYKRSSIYWHATGYYDDQWQHPEKMEHFGISTVEAMAAGVVPIVIAKGGQREILGKKLSDCGWLTQDECLAKTVQVMKDKALRAKYSSLACERAQYYSLTNFQRRCRQMLTKT